MKHVNCWLFDHESKQCMLCGETVESCWTDCIASPDDFMDYIDRTMARAMEGLDAVEIAVAMYKRRSMD